jgi:glycosyltransferase involved in cell wall biosynthesis
VKDYPLVSICIPTYNGAAFIAEAMDSAIVQTYPNLEIIVSDDASTDGTLEIIESYKTRTAIPIHIFHHEPRGIGANWNHCMRQANGVYIKFLFQDDVLEPQCIEEMVKVINQDKSMGFVACKREFIVEPSFLNADTKKWIEIYGDLQSTLHLPVHHGLSIINKSIFKSDTLFKSPLNKIGEPTTILFRKDLIDTIGYFREDLKQVLDYEFCYRVLKKKNIGIITDKLVKFRLHNMQATVKNKDNETYAADHKIYERLIFDHYFWYLNSTMQKRLLRKYNWFAGFFYNTLDAIKRIIPS